MEKVILSLGTNLGDKSTNLTQVIKRIESEVGVVLKQSATYGSSAMGFEGESFENMAIEIQTRLAPDALLAVILAIEIEMGRDRLKGIEGYSNRIIDIDIIFYGDWIIESKHLIVPHPEMLKRNFVLKPLNDIAENWIHPIKLEPVMVLLEKSTDNTRLEWVR